ncbi:HAUS augmin-like complex subunit 1, partial [Oxyura jamaicensis]|uniref:HAUS augmin-like complex subunit 1 n=1 Tax=Oxyura jamaicensis TaxID=8884 RepID=UPI0015A6266C
STSCFCAINDMSSELHTTESKNREMELELTNIRKKQTAALVLEKQRSKDLKKKTKEHLEVERAKAESRSQNLKFMKDKSENFKIKIKAAEEQLAATELDQSLTHRSLVSMFEVGLLVQDICFYSNPCCKWSGYSVEYISLHGCLCIAITKLP